jgi:hypothetical protein
VANQFSGCRAHQGIRARFRFLPARKSLWAEAVESFHWILNIKSTPEHFASDHVFRSPAVILMSGCRGVALIADLNVESTKKQGVTRPA